MPARRDSVRKTKRILRRNATNTADVVTYRQVAPVGRNFGLVVVDEECETELLIKKETPGVSTCPGTQGQVLNAFGGSRALTLASAPTGRQGAAPIQLEEEESPQIGPAPAPAGAFMAFDFIDSTHIGVELWDEDAVFIETLHESLTVPSGQIEEGKPGIAIIVGDASLPDRSFTIGTSDFIYSVNGTTGAFAQLFDISAELGPEFTSPDGVCFRGVHWDKATQKVFVATSIDANFAHELFSANADGSGQTSVGSITSSLSPASSTVNKACVWASDRCIMFLGTSEPDVFSGCVEVHFDGTVVDRPGDLPDQIGRVSGSLQPSLYPSEDGYIIDIHDDDDYLVSGKMPNTTGDEVSTNWDPNVIFPPVADTERLFASLVAGRLYCYPCQISAVNTDIYILSVEKDTVPTSDDLIRVLQADPTGGATPFCVLRIPD